MNKAHPNKFDVIFYCDFFIGKLCLQNETLAKDCIAALTKEMDTSQDPAVRNNITVVLCDLCVRYEV